jgi:predicted unusual protein kinase regulating ubiquinone biosynthesis (AarF/ABC1/UbiB family)
VAGSSSLVALDLDALFELPAQALAFAGDLETEDRVASEVRHPYLRPALDLDLNALLRVLKFVGSVFAMLLYRSIYL